MKSRLLFTPFFTITLLFLSFSAYSADAPSEKTPLNALKGEALHIKLVEVAYQYDSYNKRCRGLSISREVDEVNRLFLRKYGITINNFIKLNIDRDTRGYQQSIQRDFYNTLYEMGGCEATKETDFLDTMRNKFRLLIDNTQTSPWFPRT